MTDWDKQEKDVEQGDYMASLAENYFYATHPKERPWLMDKVEVARIKKEYRSLIPIQNQKVSGTSEKVSL